MCTSSSSGRISKRSAVTSSRTVSSACSSTATSSAPMIPCRPSMRTCASDCSMSYGARRQSNAIELLSAWKVGSCGSEYRDTPGRLRSGRSLRYHGQLRGEHDPQRVQRDTPRHVRPAAARVETAVGPAADRDYDRDEEEQPQRDQRVRRPAAHEILELEAEVLRDPRHRA